MVDWWADHNCAAAVACPALVSHVKHWDKTSTRARPQVSRFGSAGGGQRPMCKVVGRGPNPPHIPQTETQRRRQRLLRRGISEVPQTARGTLLVSPVPKHALPPVPERLLSRRLPILVDRYSPGWKAVLPRAFGKSRARSVLPEVPMPSHTPRGGSTCSASAGRLRRSPPRRFPVSRGVEKESTTRDTGEGGM